jgi:hypothetical protein
MSTSSIVTKMGNFYWLLAGALMGFGLMAAFSIGIAFFLPGMFMALYRVWRVGGRGFGLVLVGMGLLPAVYLPLRYFTADRSNTFYPDDWWKGLLVYLGLAVVGAVWATIDLLRAEHRHHTSA